VKKREVQVDCYALLQCFENYGKEALFIIMMLIDAKNMIPWFKMEHSARSLKLGNIRIKDIKLV
jgi:hypothetical protein